MSVKFEGMTQKDNLRFFTYSVDMGDMHNSMACNMVTEIFESCSKKISEEYLKENKQLILSKLDSQAILNLALAKSAAKVFDDIKK